MYTFEKYKRCLRIIVDDVPVWTIPYRKIRRLIRASYVEVSGSGFYIGIYPGQAGVTTPAEVADLISTALAV